MALHLENNTSPPCASRMRLRPLSSRGRPFPRPLFVPLAALSPLAPPLVHSCRAASIRGCCGAQEGTGLLPVIRRRAGGRAARLCVSSGSRSGNYVCAAAALAALLLCAWGSCALNREGSQGHRGRSWFTPDILTIAADQKPRSSYVKILQSPFNDRPMCRICHEGSSQEDLLSPCECTGTLGTIHRSCLEHWLSSSNTTYCELCHFRFAVERKPRPLVEWLRNPGPQHEKRTLFGDMVCFLFITPLATISGWLCLRGAVDHLHFSSRLEAVGLIALTVALFTIYLFWTLVSFRYHCRLYNEWRRTNQRVILLIPKSVSIPSNQQSLLGLHSVKRNSKETIV
uniref:E3 ubiquitin-protein ligase MARCHF3 n=1 Tax=Anolis carolinensis TaxID=28377 RepID=G1KB44_ANOCA